MALGMPRMRRMEKVQDLVEEAKRRTLLWLIFVAILAYLLSLTSNSVFVNIPVAILILAALRYLSFELEIRKRVQEVSMPSHLSHLLKHQISFDNPLLCCPPVSTQWKRKIDSPMVEAAIDDFTGCIVKEFVIDLWYSSLSPDQDVPEQLRLMINDIFGEISQRAKRINLISLLTRDLVDLVGNHLDLFRQTKASIGAKLFDTLSSEEREERLKLMLMKKNQLHPALFSSEYECKVLQQLMGGVVAMLLRPQDAQCPLMRGLARELLACAVLRPVMNFASPSFINKAIERATTTAKEKSQSSKSEKGTNGNLDGKSSRRGSLRPSEPESPGHQIDSHDLSKSSHGPDFERDWAQVLDAVSKRRNTTLAPENLDNLWAKGRNYKKRDLERIKPNQAASGGVPRTSSEIPPKTPSEKYKGSVVRTANVNSGLPKRDLGQSPVRGRSFEEGPPFNRDIHDAKRITSDDHQERHLDEPLGIELPHQHSRTTNSGSEGWQKLEKPSSSQITSLNYWDNTGIPVSTGNVQLDQVTDWLNESEGTSRRANSAISKLNCWVVGAHLERIASKTFAVYSIAVTDSDNNTWFVERRFRNFEQLHRNLRDLPQYNLQLPPKRILSSSLDDAFVRDRCILLDKYLKDLLSIPSLAELHEVWDFLSITSKKYAFAKSPSVMKTIAVNVDDAVEDMVRQLRGVSDGIFRQLGGPPSPTRDGTSLSTAEAAKAFQPPESLANSSITYLERERSEQFSDDEYEGLAGVAEEGSAYLVDGWHSDSEIQMPDSRANSATQRHTSEQDKSGQGSVKRIRRVGSDIISPEESLAGSEAFEDDPAVPPEWTPPKLTVPLLNLVDGIFQLKRRGWIRRQVFWMAKQILQLGMGDAVDDWLVTQVQWLRKEDVVASAIRWVKEILWPGGVFITKSKKEDNIPLSEASLNKTAKQSLQKGLDQSALFESQLEASRCARVVHEVLVDGGPAALVSLVGKKQYTRCAKDIYYFLQSTVFLKQLMYSVLETLLTATFPELSRLILDIRRQGPGQVVI